MTRWLCGVMALVLAGGTGRAEQPASEAPHRRHFRFDYGAAIEGLKAGQQVRVWLPIPPSNDAQQVRRLESRLPAPAREEAEGRYGNQLLYFELTMKTDAPLDLNIVYDVTRHELKRRGVPNDRVDDHVVYDKSRPGYGRGDVAWVCDSRFGNCSDFHSLFMSLARSQGILAKFEIGFPLPDQRGQGDIAGYHCWAYFYNEQRGWVPVDISEADKHPQLKDYYFGNLTENRVTFSTGRDLELKPRPAGQPVNFLVYPYVEVDNEPLAAMQLKLKCRFADIE